MLVNAVPFGQQFSQFISNDEPTGKVWVVLCAAANGWYNFGIQADVYHSYQLVKEHGIPDEQIIVFHYDDLATHKSNPTPGKIINEPNGTNVYEGVPKHYTGKDVTPENFLGALKGSNELANAGKKVVKSGPNDRIFVYLMDHGAPGLVAFPNSVLHATDLNKALVEMHQNKKYSQLVFYLEACESGSMFYKLLPDNINAYAVTATKPDQDGYFYYDDDTYDTCLGTYFAAMWFDDWRHNDPKVETFDQEFAYFTKHRSKKLPQSTSNSVLMNKNIKYIKSREAAVHLLQQKINRSNGVSEKLRYTEELETLLNGRQSVDKHMTEYVNSIQHLLTVDSNAILNTKQELNNRQCYRKLVDTYAEQCLDLGQADVYHAYQVVRANGIPDENIILMYYDDIAYHKRNPTPGVVVNRPDGSDVYKGVPKDRAVTGDDITPERFLAVLKGDKEMAGNDSLVFDSGPDDHVFVYLIDHGAPGSMFDKLLPNDINVYVTTASAPDEESNFCCYDKFRHADTARFDNNCEGVNKRNVAIDLLEKQIDNSVDNNEKLGYN
ncbi:unnamed protein product [Medioppia subpectinata]|uniref:legumain n=1 Tax=Medioppia subpectinata TaxID=1979941 RepID=A0A7R9KU97_9ACAR|nr:unnamed protein product [Medioppia subpectinata]CAG2109585.1 unnamed protein product [Medioppia subpectinata]